MIFPPLNGENEFTHNLYKTCTVISLFQHFFPPTTATLKKMPTSHFSASRLTVPTGVS